MRRKSLLSLLLVSVLVLMGTLFFGAFSASAGSAVFSGGTGTEEDPYLISSEADLVALRASVAGGESYAGKYIALARDLTLKGTLAPIGSVSAPFAGTFDGQGNAIMNLRVSGSDYVGLFGYVSGSVKNLTVTGSVTGTAADNGKMGFLCGYLSGSLEGCVARGNLSASSSNVLYAGGLCGYVSVTGRVSDCYTSVAVTANGAKTCYAGGFAGSVAGSVTRSGMLSGSISASGASLTKGGFAGELYFGEIIHCFTSVGGTQVGKTYTRTASSGDNIVDFGSLSGCNGKAEFVTAQLVLLPSCTQKAEYKVSCSTCSYSATWQTAATCHTYGEVEVAGNLVAPITSCLIPGEYYYGCTSCGKADTTRTFVSDNYGTHTPDNSVYHSHTASGHTVSCATCGTHYETAHTYESTVVEMAEGYRYTCPCGYEMVDSASFTVLVKSGEGIVGKTVRVEISLLNNPGINGFQFEIAYDTAKLALLSADVTGFGTVVTSQTVGAVPYRILCAQVSNHTASGTVAVLEFQILEDCPAGLADLSVTVKCANEGGQRVSPLLAVVDGGINVIKVIKGDVNGDGEVTLADATLLVKHLADWPVTLDENAADVNGDGEVDLSDATLLKKYLANWGVTIG